MTLMGQSRTRKTTNRWVFLEDVGAIAFSKNGKTSKEGIFLEKKVPIIRIKFKFLKGKELKIEDIESSLKQSFFIYEDSIPELMRLMSENKIVSCGDETYVGLFYIYKRNERIKYVSPADDLDIAIGDQL